MLLKVGDVINIKLDAKVVALVGCRDAVYPICVFYDEGVLGSDTPFMVAVDGSKIDTPVCERYVKWMNEFCPPGDN